MPKNQVNLFSTFIISGFLKFSRKKFIYFCSKYHTKTIHSKYHAKNILQQSLKIRFKYWLICSIIGFKLYRINCNESKKNVLRANRFKKIKSLDKLARYLKIDFTNNLSCIFY